MRTLTKIFAPALVASFAIASVAPASAAEVHNGNRAQAAHMTPVRNDTIRTQISQLSRDIDRASQRGTLSRRESASLKRDLGELRGLYGRYARGGLDRSEVRMLERKADQIRASLRAERHDFNKKPQHARR